MPGQVPLITSQALVKDILEQIFINTDISFMGEAIKRRFIFIRISYPW